MNIFQKRQTCGYSLLRSYSHYLLSALVNWYLPKGASIFPSVWSRLSFSVSLPLFSLSPFLPFPPLPSPPLLPPVLHFWCPVTIPDSPCPFPLLTDVRGRTPGRFLHMTKPFRLVFVNSLHVSHCFFGLWKVTSPLTKNLKKHTAVNTVVKFTISRFSM